MWEVSVITTAEAGEAVAELLGQLFACAPVIHTDFESGATTVAIYSATQPLQLPARLQAVRAGLRHVRGSGLNVGLGRVRARPMPRRNWAESWKRHFKPLAIGEGLLLKPSWSQRRPARNQAVVVLDPGLCFGTGHHPTTAYCLRELERRSRRWRRLRLAGHSRGSQSRRATTGRQHPAETRRAFLDLGTGSGVLAIAAAKLGYSPVHAVDCDPDAVRVARANARVNGVSQRIRINRGDIARLARRPARRYDVIAANLLAPMLVTHRHRIAARLNPGGTLLVAGILKAEFGRVATRFRRLGLRLVRAKSEREWRSGTFVR